MVFQSRPEPMNASPHHSKVKVTLALSDPVYVAGGHISGKMQVECRADLDSLLGIGVMMVELYAIQEVNSGAHSATSTFTQSRRIFQGPGLPPSNAVYADHAPGAGEVPLPAHHHAARRGQTTFFFQFPIPASSPSSINFGPASIRYEIRASASVAWRGDKHLVTDMREVKVVESWDPTNAAPSPQAVVITEGGKIWAQATLTNALVVGGESTRIDLQLKNHTQRWTSGVTITLTRNLHLSPSFLAGKPSPNLSDIATQVEFRGPEYSVPPGIEGIASLVIDIPRHSRGVKGGPRVDDNGKATEGFFEVSCTLRVRIDMPPGSEDTVITLPLIIYHSLAVPKAPTPSPRLTSSPYPYPAPVSPELLLPPPPVTELMPTYTGNQMQQYDPMWTAPSARPASNYSLHQHLEQETHNWKDGLYTCAPPVQRSASMGPPLQAPYYMPGLSSSYTPSPRLLPLPPTHVSYAGYVHPGVPVERADGFTIPDQFRGGTAASPPSQNMYSATHYCSVSPSSPRHPRAPDQPLTPSRPPPIQIPSLPNPHDSRGVLHSPRPVPSPKHSFYGLVPKSDNVSVLECMADNVGKQAGNLSLDLPRGDAGVDVQARGPRHPDVSVDKTLPAPPVPSCKDKGPFAHRRPRADALFTAEDAMPEPDHSDFPSPTDHLPRAPPTPPIAAITPIKFPKAPTELLGLGANLGKDVSPESGLDALERRLLAEVGTRKFDVDERPHVRSVVQPIAIPPSAAPLDAVNDSAISSLTLADREGIPKANLEREQEQDRDSDERTQHIGGGGHSVSEDDRDARTQKGKSSRKLGKSKHSEEDLERAGRRRERKKVKVDEGRKLRREAKGRVAAWLGEIDISVPPVIDDPGSFISPTAPHFVPITENESFGPAQAEMTDDEPEEPRRGGDPAADKDVSASPNPRSSGFVTISSLSAGTSGSGGQATSFKCSPRRLSLNDFRQTPTFSPNQPTMTTLHGTFVARSPSAEVKRSEPADAAPRTRPSQPQPQHQPPPMQPPPAQPNRLFAGRLPRFPFKSADPETKYDIRSARGGRGGKVTQVASLWAAKVNANASASANIRAADVGPKKPKVPAPSPGVRRPSNVPKRAPTSTHVPPGDISGGVDGGSPAVAAVVPVDPKRVEVGDDGEIRMGAGTGVGTAGVVVGTGMGKGTGVGTGIGAGLGQGMPEASKVTKATTVPAVLSSSHAIPMLSSTASLARVKAHGAGQGAGAGAGAGAVRSLPPMISETMSDLRSVSKSGGGGGIKASVGGGAGGGQGRALGDLAFGQARLRDLIKKYQG